MGRTAGGQKAAGRENVADRDQVDGIGQIAAVLGSEVDLADAVVASVAFAVDGVLGEWTVAVVV